MLGPPDRISLGYNDGGNEILNRPDGRSVGARLTEGLSEGEISVMTS